MRLGGIDIEADFHCAGHSDGDAICHAVTDAILGAAGLGDIGEMFPDTDVANKNKDSIVMLIAARERLHDAGYGPHRDAIRARLSEILHINVADVFVKGKTNEGLGWIGRNEGLAVMAVASITATTQS